MLYTTTKLLGLIELSLMLRPKNLSLALYRLADITLSFGHSHSIVYKLCILDFIEGLWISLDIGSFTGKTAIPSLLTSGLTMQHSYHVLAYKSR
jgi:hypothetical protein